MDTFCFRRFVSVSRISRPGDIYFYCSVLSFHFVGERLDRDQV